MCRKWQIKILLKCLDVYTSIVQYILFEKDFCIFCSPTPTFKKEAVLPPDEKKIRQVDNLYKILCKNSCYLYVSTKDSYFYEENLFFNVLFKYNIRGKESMNQLQLYFLEDVLKE